MNERPEKEPGPPVTEPGGVPWGLALALILAVAIIVFAVQNTQVVELRFLVWQTTAPLVVIIAVAVVASIVFDEVLGWALRRRRRRRLAEKEELRRLRELRKEQDEGS